MDQNNLPRLRKELLEITTHPDVMAILLFGSQVTGEMTERSDTDICIVAPTVEDQKSLLKWIWRSLKVHLDVWLFDELPLYLKIQVIKHHQIIYARNIPELFEYFFLFRRDWEHQAIHRITQED